MLEKLVRKNVLALQPYSSARDEFTSEAEIFIDANENPHNWMYNRYPDPYQKKLKSAISEWKHVDVNNIFLGSGSDEIIDLLIRAFCEPKEENIVVLNPSYGMYKVSADINNVGVKYFSLDKNFCFKANELLDSIAENDKIIFICSPNNPSGNLVNNETILNICENFTGLVVVDEAYIDFADTPGMIDMVSKIPNLVVMQTLSKAMGAAGLRLGMGFMNEFLVKILNKIKPPYNINTGTQEVAYNLVVNRSKKSYQIETIKSERKKLADQFQKLNFVKEVFPSDANFILVQVKNADHLYNYLLDNGIVARNRNKQFRCEGCIRFTIGTPEENLKLIESLYKYQDKN